jgi:hypothetical protein
MWARWREALFSANSIVLLSHQIDAAYWREWTPFGIPGGIQVFVLLNIPIIALILFGQRALAFGRESGSAISWALAASGVFAVAFHGFHLLRGDDAFRTPVSLALLFATLVLSLAQGIVLSLSAHADRRQVGPTKRGSATAL